MKKTIYILVFFIGLNFTAAAQNKSAVSGGTAKVIKAYPTPATTVIYFDFVSGYDRSYTFEIYNFSGKKVYELKNPTPKISLQLDDFTRGFYYYQLRDKAGRIVETARFLVLK